VHDGCRLMAVLDATAALRKLGFCARLVSLAGAIVLVAQAAPTRAATIFATPSGGAGYDGQGQRVAISTHRFDDSALALLRPGDTLQLLADAPTGTTSFSGPVTMVGKGDANSPPIVIRGLRDRTVVVGASIDAVRGCPMPADDLERRCNSPSLFIAGLSTAGQIGRGDLLKQFTDEVPRGPRSDTVMLSVPSHGTNGPLRTAACIDLDRIDGITIEDLRFESCWLSAVRAVGSRRITLQQATILGGSYGLAVRGKAGWPAERLTVQDVTWIQDVSGYARLSADGKHLCKVSDGTVREVDRGCPGEMWRTLPWGVSHHGSAEHYNGALLGGVDVTGQVVFRRNRIFSAYNGIRLKANACEAVLASKLSPETCAYNDQIWIGDNVFSYVRDNPVEMEVWSRNVHIVRNEFHNSHAWLSFDDMGGGPVYAYANRGWFDDMPSIGWATPSLGARPCVRDAKSKPSAGGAFDEKLDRRFDYRNGIWLPVAVMGRETKNGNTMDVWMSEGEQSCEASLVGRTLKFALPEKGATPDTFRYPSEPIYVFNNSWFLRAPITGTGAAVRLRHWNNAILFCEAGVEGFDAGLCQPRPAAFDPACGAGLAGGDDLRRYRGATGELPFFDCFRWLPVDEAGKPRGDLESDFDHDVSSNGFPSVLRSEPRFEPSGRSGDPGFVAANRGDFRLKAGSLASRSGCLVEVRAEALGCAATGEERASFAGAFAPTGEIYPGPVGPQFVEPP